MINGEYADINGSLAIINAKPPLKEIVAASDAYPKGWHEGNPGGLDAIDTDLAAGNIKDGIIIFGKLGTLTVTPTVTSEISGNCNKYNSLVYTTCITGTITGGKDKVVFSLCAGGAGFVTQARWMYDGVERVFQSASYTTFNSVIINGLAGDATATLEYKSNVANKNAYTGGEAVSIGAS